MNSETFLQQAGSGPVSAQVARHLMGMVARENLMPGDGVPSEIQLAKDLQVSRGTVREAYRTLAALGILNIENGKRPRLQAVRAEGLAQVFGYALTIAQVNQRHVIDTRRGIELHGAQQAAKHVNDAQKSRLRHYVDEMRESLVDGNTRRRIVADIGIHNTLAEASGNPLNVLLLGALRSPIEQSMAIDVGSRRNAADLVRIVDAHALIVDRVCEGDAVGAGSAMAVHFDMSFASTPRVVAEPAGAASAAIPSNATDPAWVLAS